MFLNNVRTACYLGAFRPHALSQVTGFHGTQLFLCGGGCNRNQVGGAIWKRLSPPHEIQSYSTWPCKMISDR